MVCVTSAISVVALPALAKRQGRGGRQRAQIFSEYSFVATTCRTPQPALGRPQSTPACRVSAPPARGRARATFRRRRCRPHTRRCCLETRDLRCDREFG